MDVKSIFYKMQLKRFELFKEQDYENGDFDVIFEIDGKKLYANRYVLCSISDTFKSMLSERWTKKDEPIILGGYRYEDFYQFLSFIYAAKCKLTDENIFAMVDIAEYYAVEAFKDACDEYLSAMKYDINTISEIMECANKYLLIKLKTKLIQNVDQHFFELIDPNYFLNVKKFVINYFLSCERNRYREEKLFEAVYNWAEKHASIKHNSSIIELGSSLKEVIKEEMTEFLPKFDFILMSHKFLLQFVVTKCGHLFSHEDLGAILLENYNKEAKTQVKLLDSDCLHLDSDDEDDEEEEHVSEDEEEEVGEEEESENEEYEGLQLNLYGEEDAAVVAARRLLSAFLLQDSSDEEV
uniref:BTB domain-containing protein n=1 Tax=Panagrolaimus superbus TaxID=310955 RepID=A0A914YVR0_9BILA